MLNEVPIQLNDLEDVRQIINSCLNYFTAKDLERAQIKFSAMTKSPLTQELEILKTRFDGYLADFLLARHEEENEEVEHDDLEPWDDPDDPDDPDEPEDEEVTPEPEPLSSAPLGSTKFPKQKSRRVTKEELQEREDIKEEE